MARDTRNRMPQGGEEQEEMTVVILRFKGGSESLQKGFDAVSQALATLGQPTVRQRRLAAPPQTPAVRGDGTHGGDKNGEKPVEVEGIEGEFETISVEASEESPQRGGG